MNIAVFCGSGLPGDSRITKAAETLGRRLAEDGHTLIYGGSNLGLMGVVSGAALAQGGHVVGVIPTLFSEEIIRSQPVTELVRVRSMAERKEYIIACSDAFVALPGGIGTLDEVLEVMVANQLGLVRDRSGANLPQGKPMYLLNLDGFFNPFLEQLRQMHQMGFVRAGGEASLHAVASTEELFLRLNQNKQ
ncbi:MAG: TIGR00730 family Rossman fold protein [Bacteroidales bacterium]|nr:TIGR00730 family Rossman fold protein [Bacteroidales bacterium]